MEQQCLKCTETHFTLDGIGTAI